MLLQLIVTLSSASLRWRYACLRSEANHMSTNRKELAPENSASSLAANQHQLVRLPNNVLKPCLHPAAVKACRRSASKPDGRRQARTAAPLGTKLTQERKEQSVRCTTVADQIQRVPRAIPTGQKTCVLKEIGQAPPAATLIVDAVLRQ